MHFILNACRHAGRRHCSRRADACAALLHKRADALRALCRARLEQLPPSKMLQKMNRPRLAW